MSLKQRKRIEGAICIVLAFGFGCQPHPPWGNGAVIIGLALWAGYLWAKSNDSEGEK
jgi:hypothetical protein